MRLAPAGAAAIARSPGSTSSLFPTWLRLRVFSYRCR